MALEVSEVPECSEVEIMDESLECIFFSIVSSDVLDAIDFIRSVDHNFIPSKKVMHTIIFEVLMKNDDVRCLALSSDYLVTVLRVFPPNSAERGIYYYDSIRNNHGYLDDLWTVYSHVVNSYFYHRKIYDIEKGETSRAKPINYPNCKFLLEFYVKLFSVDFECLSTKNFAACLVIKLLWPNNNICMSNRTEMLLKWINDIYSNPSVNDMGDLLESMHEVLNLMIKCIIQGKHKLSDLAAFRNPCLSEIVEAAINFCKNAFINHSTVRLFLSSLSLKYFKARVCEKLIKQITKQGSKRVCVLTLSDIVNQCMFPQKFNKWKNPKPSVSKERNLRKRVTDKKASVSMSDKKMVSETSKLHELCRKNKFGDLLQALQSSNEDINARDPTGSTPLHEACQGSNYMCVKVLITESAKDSVPNLEFSAANLEGLTPLHIAARTNSTDIARALLSSGGADLQNAIDNRGYRPSDYSSSEEMNKLLQEFQPEISSNESDSTTETNIVKEAPNLKNFKEYSIYLQALTCLLCTYCDLFNLYDFTWKKTTLVQNHSDKICCHFLDEDVCSEDASLISQMPDLVDMFIGSIKKNVSKLGINVDIELIPLKSFAASLKTS